MLNFLAGVIVGIFIVKVINAKRKSSDKWVIYEDYRFIANTFTAYQHLGCTRVVITAKGYKNNDRHESEVELNFVSVENQLNSLINK